MKEKLRNKWEELQCLWARRMELMTRGFSRRTWLIWLWALILTGSLGSGYRIYRAIWDNSGSRRHKIRAIETPIIQEDSPDGYVKPKTKNPYLDMESLEGEHSHKRLPKDSIGRSSP